MEEISVLSAGERFSFKGFDWITLGHTEDGGVLAIMDGCWKEIPFDNKRDYTNNYAKSTLRKTLLEELLPVLGEENLLPHVVDLVADNGDDSYGTVTDKVFILSCDEYRKYRKHIPLLNEWSWTCTPWWIDPTSGHGSNVRFIDPAGYLNSGDAYGSSGVAPACVFNPAHLKLRRQAQMVEE